jgi:glycosyltransferase involved in cell wall biosynthesis
MEKLLLSVVICTYNRANYLEKVLQSLLEQNVDIDNYEILVIDNNSNDNTKQVIEKFQKLSQRIRYYFEPNQGIAYSRTAAFTQTNSEIIGFTDDDCIAEPNWIQSIIDSFTLDSNIGVAGGKIDLIWNTEPPLWLNDELIAYLGYFNLGTEAKYISGEIYFFGANVAFRRDKIKSHQFDTNLGMTGDKIGCNEEIQFQVNARKSGTISYYNPGMQIFHHVRKESNSIKWMKKRLLIQGKTNALGENNEHLNLFQRLRMFAAIIYLSIFIIGLNIVKSDKLYSKYLIYYHHLAYYYYVLKKLLIKT